MTEIYEAWLSNPNTQPILKGYGADKLTPEQQVACERLVLSNRRSNFIPSSEYKRLIKTIQGGMSGAEHGLSAGNLVNDLRAVVRDAEVLTRSGTDSNAHLGDGSGRFGLGYIQSAREPRD